ncbi:hypothetical protein [Hymenobacter metallilatus]|uniref:Uncharacterized protein n=1 Tax=Hymenobacter metallilatus TaxID=2493666 RepID=A0A3R9PA05_9BACT|nr:hypothetical protein [Hymenobacter metallilatus]RSK31789.1 hypothetical protein EI290_13270 [Hymenobacter metallilatus]
MHIASIGIIYGQSFRFFEKKRNTDTLINLNNIHYIQYKNIINHKSGIILGKSRIECEITIDDKSFGISPGNVHTKKPFIYSTITSKNIFNNYVNDQKEGMWISFNKDGHVDFIQQYKMDKIFMIIFFKKNGRIEKIDWYNDGVKRRLGSWIYDRKNRILNHNLDF